MKASDQIVKALEREGVEVIFGLPGEENLDLLDSLSRSTITLVPTRHEQAAGFMAATYGRLTGRPGVCLATLGPGATNLLTAVAFANHGGMPMVVLTGQKPIHNNSQGNFQLIDVVSMMEPVSKSTCRLESASRAAFAVREAFRLAQQERPGVSHIEIPEDVAQASSAEVRLEASYVRRPVAEKKALERTVHLIHRARRPLLLVGAGANRKRTSSQLRRFVNHTETAFCTTQMGKGVVSETDPRYLGTAALSDGDFVHRALESADLILNVGHDLAEKPPFVMDPGGLQKVIHVNYSPARVCPVYFPQTELVGDIAHSIRRLNAILEPGCGHDESGYFARLRSARQACDAELLRGSEVPVSPQILVNEMNRSLSKDAVVCLDNGLYKLWFARNYETHFPNTLLLDNSLASMGAGLPSAVTAALLHPDRQVVAVCGDGGFLMNSGELETAARLQLDLTVIVLRDNRYGMIRWKQQELEFSDYGLDFENPDFVAFAESYGATGHRIRSLEELRLELEDLDQAQGLVLLEVPVDYSRCDELLNERIPQLSRRFGPLQQQPA